MLRESMEVDIIERLDLEVRRRLELQEWRLAIIESAIMFESWIQPIIRNHYLKLLGSKSKVDSKLSFRDKDDRKHPMPMGDILKSLVEEAFGFSFQLTEEYKGVTTNTITPRNKIVHGTGFHATKQTAIAAYVSARAAINAIRPYTFS
jgi:hypothetical protein